MYQHFNSTGYPVAAGCLGSFQLSAQLIPAMPHSMALLASLSIWKFTEQVNSMGQLSLFKRGDPGNNIVRWWR
jgi:hypothetical protein